MLTYLGIILLVGLAGAKVFEKIGLPQILGMLIGGIIISPYQLGIIGENINATSPDLRQIALLVILSRAGLSLDIERLKKVGKPAFLLSFLPATIEMAAITFFAAKLFKLTYIDAAILGSVLAAVSPAIVVPRMIKLMDEGYGKDKAIPEMILSAASVDDVIVIVFFTSFLTLKTSGEISFMNFLNIPISIILGIGMGYAFGKIMAAIFKKVNLSRVYKAIIYLSSSFMMLEIENVLENKIAISALIAIMVAGMVLNYYVKEEAKEILGVYNDLWQIFEIFLFVLVGIAVDLSYIREAGIMAVLLIFIGLNFRIVGVNLALIPSDLNKKEKLFTSLAYLPKATVQAAIGPVALAMGIASGELILSVSVIAILLTAPLGAIASDRSYFKLLDKS